MRFDSDPAISFPFASVDEVATLRDEVDAFVALEESEAGNMPAARDWLDPVLTRSSWLELMIDRPVDAAALLRATSLRAELAAGAGDKAGAKRWSAFVATLWTHADRELLPQVQRMRQFAN